MKATLIAMALAGAAFAQGPGPRECEVETNPPKPMSRVCHGRGMISDPMPLGSPFTTSGGPQGCFSDSQGCTSTQGCQSFSFDSSEGSSGTCTLYSAKVRSMGYKKFPRDDMTFFSKFCFKYNCMCEADGLTQCSDYVQACYDLSSDEDNCGSCGNKCSSGDTCYNGVCSTPCDNPITECNIASNPDSACGSPLNQNCYCLIATDDQTESPSGVCIDQTSTSCASAPVCTSNSDCTLGSTACLETCCSGSESTLRCVPVSNTCADPSDVRRLFQSKSKKDLLVPV